MYAKFFGLKQAPFSIAPDPHYLFMSERHRDALAHLLYGVSGGGGFVLLTGEIGAGKTTVCRCFLEQIPQGCNVAYIFNPKLTVTELLKTVCEEYGVSHEHPAGEAETIKQYVDPLNAFLLSTHAQGQNNVLIIDEAQNLSADVLEQLRLLTNLETNDRKLLQIVLIGQPELRTMLARPELEQLAQRVIARFHLTALSESETAQYIRHRLAVAGFNGELPFDRAASRRVHRLSRGVPRRINLLCDRALLGAYAHGRTRVDRATLDQAAAEVFDDGQKSGASIRGDRRMWWGLGATGVLAGTLVLMLATRSQQGVAGHSDAAVAAIGVGAPASMVLGAAPQPATAASVAEKDVKFASSITLALRDEDDAWRELAQAWKPGEISAGDACEALQHQQLQCFRSDDGMALLRVLARPAVLILRDDAGKPFYVKLVKLGSQYATVQAGANTQTVSLVALAKQWRGEFFTLWRAPPGYQAGLMNEPMIDWLDQHLAKTFGESAQSGARKYGPVMRAKVAAFQRAQGLKVDGLAGPITLMQLSRAAGVDEPRLQTDAVANRV